MKHLLIAALMLPFLCSAQVATYTLTPSSTGVIFRSSSGYQVSLPLNSVYLNYSKDSQKVQLLSVFDREIIFMSVADSLIHFYTGSLRLSTRSRFDSFYNAAMNSSGGGGGSSVTAGAGLAGTTVFSVDQTYSNTFTATQTISKNNIVQSPSAGLSLINYTPADDVNPSQNSPSLKTQGNGSDGAGGSSSTFSYEIYESISGPDGRHYLYIVSILAGVRTDSIQISGGSAVSAGQFNAGTNGVSSNGTISTIAGKTFKVTSGGGNPTTGTFTLISGQKTVSTTAVSTGDQIVLSGVTPSGTIGTYFQTSIVNNTSFTISSYITVGGTATLNTLDLSTLMYTIIKH